MNHPRTIAQGLLSNMDFPGAILTGVPVVEIKGMSEAVVICHRGVIGYEPNRVRIASALGAVTVNGEELTIFRMNRERIVLHGKITSVEIGDSLC